LALHQKLSSNQTHFDFLNLPALNKKQFSAGPVGSPLPIPYVFEELILLDSGSCFGDLALLKDKPRQARVLCKVDC